MKEIKFRVLDEKENKYIGFEKCYEGFWFYSKDGNNWVNGTFNGAFLKRKLYTDRKDKNGKEIYEGDWCRADFRTRDGIQVVQGVIIMDEYMWCLDCTGSVSDDIFSINRLHNFEVIGNIY